MLGNATFEFPQPYGLRVTLATHNHWQVYLQDHVIFSGILISPTKFQLNRDHLQGELLLPVCHAIFSSIPTLECISLEAASPLANADYMQRTSDGEYLLFKSVLWQLDELWLTQSKPKPFPHLQVLDDAGYHPLRAEPLTGGLYQRYIPELKSWIKLRTLDLERDLELFNRWQNDERVAAFWDQKGSLDEHREYLQAQLNDPKNQLIIASFDDQPFAYFEVYWTKEDRIAPYYSVGDYDRGIHMLVGEDNHRGPHKVSAWLSSLCHYIYLSDPRTLKIVSEPRADNEKMINYLQQQHFSKQKEFSFPHKRAALMLQLRDSFFTQFK